jgi:hypothetical protein
MAEISVNDSFIHLQIELNKLSEMEREERQKDNHGLSFHCHNLAEKVDKRLKNVMWECEHDIQDFIRLIRELREENER